MDNFKLARERMVERQLRRRGISDERVLQALRVIPRELFVPARIRDRAYDDTPLDIGWGQTISQPYIVAKMIEALNVSDGARVLEVGTGCGYQTALLALLVENVYTIEIVPELHELANSNLNVLAELNEFNGLLARIALRCGDGAQGWPEAGPFDGVIVSAAAPEDAPVALLDQLAPDGRALIPIGTADQKLYCFTRTVCDTILSEELLDVRFVPLVNPNEDAD